MYARCGKHVVQHHAITMALAICPHINVHGLSFPHNFICLTHFLLQQCKKKKKKLCIDCVPLDHNPIHTPPAGCHYLCSAVGLVVNLAQAADQNDELFGLALELSNVHA